MFAVALALTLVAIVIAGWVTYGFAWFVILGLFVSLVYLFLAASSVMISENQVGVVIKRFSVGGNPLPQGRVVAWNGEAGYHAKTLPPGFRTGCWFRQYS